MGSIHTVEQGEFLALIARNYGFARLETIWNHENNADLRTLRENPNILLPGDQVFIPDKTGKRVEIKTAQSTKFQVIVDKLLLRLVLEEQFGGPLSGAECEVRVDGSVRKSTTDDKGVLEATVPATVQDIEVIIKEKGAPLEGVSIPVRVGHLDPVAEPTGQAARLNNLGYFAGPIEAIDAGLLASAVEEFQCDNGLTVDGKCGPLTLAKLRKAHGC
jgi:hypothetical protein